MSERLYLPQITLVAITDRDHGKTIEALIKSLKHIQPFRTILFSDVYLESDQFENILIDPLRSAKAYNEFVTYKMGRYPIDTSHILLVQYDGYVLDSSAWTDEFLQYDYIGAPWTYTDGRNVGNGGFSLRSRRLHEILSSDPEIKVGSPEDEIICRLYRGYLETVHGIKYAPDALAHRFSFEMHRPLQKTFGFHNHFHEPYREPIILKRSYAMGDVIMLEPVMEHFYKAGYRVILDTAPHLYNLFSNHHFPIEHVAFLQKEDISGYRTINFDMAYEANPKQLALLSYFQVAGIKDFTLRNPRLNFKGKPSTKLFDKYAVIHVNETDIPHRNIRGIDWELIALHLYTEGYVILQIGGGKKIDSATKINTHNEQMLAYIVGGADLFVGSDSGPAWIAVACGVKSIVFFGSVNPKYRYADFSNITVIQNACDYSGCYHEVISENGQDCRLDAKFPPCSMFSTETVLDKLNQLR